MTDILLQIGATKLALAVALAAMVWVVQQRVDRPATVHALWLMVLVVMLVPAVVPLRVLPEEVAVEVVARPEVVAQSEQLPIRVPPQEAAAETVAHSQVGPPVVADTGESGDGLAPRDWLTLNGIPLAALLWLLGSAGFFAWTVVRTVRFQRTLTRAARPAPQLQRLAAEIGDTLGLPRVPRVYTTGARLRPLVWWAGGRVRVLIPSMFVAELDEAELRAVLAHELAHVRRRDYLVRVVELLACSAYWWNPVVWWAKRKMRAAEESSCDILAVSASKLTRDRYAKSLLRVVEIMSVAPIPRAPALASTADSCRDSRQLEKRLRTVLATAPVSPTTGRLRVAGAATLACGLSLGLVYCAPGGRLAFAQPQLPTPVMSEDSAGIRIVEYAGMTELEAPFRFAEEPRYRHGAGPGDYRFRYIHAGTLLADGSAVVADAHNIELVLLSQDGTTHDVLDRQAEGPGDYNSVSAVFALGQDSIMVADRNLGRVSLFVGGSVARKVDIRRAKGLGVRGIGSSGHLLLSTGVFSWGFEEEWLAGHMARFDMDTGTLDTIASYDHLSRATAGAAWNPIRADGQVTVANGQFVYTRSDRPAITWRQPDGTVTQIVRWQAEPAPLTEEVLEGLEAIYRVGNRRANPGASEADIERITASDLVPYRAALGYPMPLFNDPIGDAEGRVWLPAYRPGSWRFDVPDYTVISADGEWLGTVEAPPGLRILDMAGGLVLGLLRDDTDAHRVVVYELIER